MPIRLPHPWGMTVEQLIEMERSLREAASRATNPKTANVLLALAEQDPSNLPSSAGTGRASISLARADDPTSWVLSRDVA